MYSSDACIFVLFAETLSLFQPGIAKTATHDMQHTSSFTAQQKFLLLW